MLHKLSETRFTEQHIPPEVEAAIPRLFEGYKDSMVSSAISASKRAEHWDKERPVPMHVGCCMLILENELDLSEPKIVTGANIKRSEGMWAYPDRQCAEMAAKNNALTSRAQFSQADKDLERKNEEIQEGNLEKQGFIAAIVTVSPSSNTGEVDTQSHDVVHPCKQCQENYKFLLKHERVSPKTIIYSARIEQGKVVASQSIELGKLLEKLEADERASVEELRTVYIKAVSDFTQRIKLLDVQMRAAETTAVTKFGSGKVLNDRLQGLQRERSEEMLAGLRPYIDIIRSAILSVEEEGVSRRQWIEVFGLESPNLNLDLSTENPLSEVELTKILEIIAEHILYLCRHSK